MAHSITTNSYIDSTNHTSLRHDWPASLKATAKSGCHFWRWYSTNADGTEWIFYNNPVTLGIGAYPKDGKDIQAQGARNGSYTGGIEASTSAAFTAEINVTVKSTGGIDTFQLSYSFDGGTATTITKALGSGGKYTWKKTVTQNNAKQCTCTITDSYGSIYTETVDLIQGTKFYTLTGNFGGSGWKSYNKVTNTVESGKQAKVTAHETLSGYGFSYWAMGTATDKNQELKRTLTSNESWTAYAKTLYSAKFDEVKDKGPTSAKLYVKNLSGVTYSDLEVQVGNTKYDVNANGYALIYYPMGSTVVEGILFKKGFSGYNLDTIFIKDFPSGYTVNFKADDDCASLFTNLPKTYENLDYGDYVSCTADFPSKYVEFINWDGVATLNNPTLGFNVYNSSEHVAYAKTKFVFHLAVNQKTSTSITMQYYTEGVYGPGQLVYSESGSATAQFVNVTFTEQWKTTTISNLNPDTTYVFWIKYSDSAARWISEQVYVKTYGKETLTLSGPVGVSFIGAGAHDHGTTVQYGCSFDSLFYQFLKWMNGSKTQSTSIYDTVTMDKSYSFTATFNTLMSGQISWNSITSHKVEFQFTNTGKVKFDGIKCDYQLQTRGSQLPDKGTFYLENPITLVTFRYHTGKYHIVCYPYYYDLNGNQICAPYKIQEFDLETLPLYKLYVDNSSDSPNACQTTILTAPTEQPNYFEYNSTAQIKATCDGDFYTFDYWSKTDVPTVWSYDAICYTDKITEQTTYYAHGSRNYSATVFIRAKSPHRINIYFTPNYTGYVNILDYDGATGRTQGYVYSCTANEENIYQLSGLTTESLHTITVYVWKYSPNRTSPYALASAQIYLKTVSKFKWTDNDANIFKSDNPVAINDVGVITAEKIENLDSGFKGKLIQIGYDGTFNYTAHQNEAITGSLIRELVNILNDMPGVTTRAIGTESQINSWIRQNQIIYAWYFANRSNSMKEVLNQAIEYFNTYDA